MKKLSYIILFALLGCGTDPQPIQQIQQEPAGPPGNPDQPQTTCWPDAWSLLHNASNDIMPFGRQITYWITPSNLTQSHSSLQYTVKIKNLSTRTVILKGTLPSPNYPLNAGQSVNFIRLFQDCSQGAQTQFLEVWSTGPAPVPQTNIIVTLTLVNAPHTLGSPVSNSMVFQ